MTNRRSVQAGARRITLAAAAVATAVLLGVAASSAGILDSGRLVLGAAPGGASDGASTDAPAALDDDTPAVANLDPALLSAVRRAAAAAAGDGITFHINSGWRSVEHQERLLREAIAEYGSEEEAARWVAAPDKSAHVSGDAVDIGPSVAAQWLSSYGARYGLCQTYRNEPWHFELRPDAVSRGCPQMYVDPTHDPRLQR